MKIGRSRALHGLLVLLMFDGNAVGVTAEQEEMEKAEEEQAAASCETNQDCPGSGKSEERGQCGDTFDIWQSAQDDDDWCEFDDSPIPHFCRDNNDCKSDICNAQGNWHCAPPPKSVPNEHNCFADHDCQSGVCKHSPRICTPSTHKDFFKVGKGLELEPLCCTRPVCTNVPHCKVLVHNLSLA